MQTMTLSVDGQNVHAATGGRAHQAGFPLAVLVHGAGMDHTVWALQSRWLAFNGMNVLSLDLPGHGQSAGEPLASIDAGAGFLAGVLEAVGAEHAAVIGHSMGALIALEFAARHPGKLSHLCLLGAALSMPVHPTLLAAAAANSHEAIDMVNLWGFGARAGIGQHASPGLWMVGVGERILERARPGVLHTDLAACNAYTNGPAAAAAVRAPTLLIAGERDQMTPLKGARALAAAIPGARLSVLAGSGHMMTAERPDALVTEFGQFLPVSRARTREATA